MESANIVITTVSPDSEFDQDVATILSNPNFPLRWTLRTDDAMRLIFECVARRDLTPYMKLYREAIEDERAILDAIGD